jgi:hypothetical protein
MTTVEDDLALIDDHQLILTSFLKDGQKRTGDQVVIGELLHLKPCRHHQKEGYALSDFISVITMGNARSIAYWSIAI